MEIKGTQGNKYFSKYVEKLKQDPTKYSDQTLRSAAKLEAQDAMQKEELHSPDAVAKARKKNLDYLKRHEGERIDLKLRRISPFAENKESAKVQSKFVIQMERQLKETGKVSDVSLEGRVTATGQGLNQGDTAPAA